MQIIGSVKCRDTKKCRLWFDQRGKKYHFVDLSQRPLSLGELKNICDGHSPDNMDAMINKNGKAWKERQLEWKDYNPLEELLQEPLLLITPVVRDGKTVVVGNQPALWKKLIDEQA